MTRYTIFVFLIIFTSLGFCNSEKNELTYIGAEKIASKNGLIPEWNGGLSRPPLNWNLNKGLVDPFRDDKLIEIIDKSKIKKYDKYLSSGLKELLKKYKNFKLYLYPTRRSLSYPKKIRKIISSNTLKQDTNLNRSNFYFSFNFNLI